MFQIVSNPRKKIYVNKNICSQHKIFSFLCPFRTAIETQLLGCRTVVVEARTSFTRNNVLKLWKYLIEDLKMLGVKKLYGKFASGNINHISIRVLQTTLLKVE